MKALRKVVFYAQPCAAVRSCTALISPSDQVVPDVSPEVISPVERWISEAPL